MAGVSTHITIAKWAATNLKKHPQIQTHTCFTLTGHCQVHSPMQAAPCILATFKGSISTSVFFFTNSNLNVLLESQVKTGRCRKRGCCQPAAKQHLGCLRFSGGDLGASACNFSLPWHVLFAICAVLSLLTVNSLLTLWQGAPPDCYCTATLSPGTSHPSGVS